MLHDDLQRLGGWLLDEARQAARWVRDPGLWATLLAALVLASSAYQVPYQQELALGGDASSQRRYDDCPFLRSEGMPALRQLREDCPYRISFHASEPADPDGPASWWDLPQEPYRWATESAALRFPGIGASSWVMSIRAAGQPSAQPTMSRWHTGAPAIPIELDREPRVYHVLARAPRGDLLVHVATDPYTVPGDARSLGFVVYHVRVMSTGGLVVPAVRQLALVLASLALIYGQARRLGVPQGAAAAGGLVLALIAALLLAFARMSLTTFTPVLAVLALGAYLLAVLLLQVPIEWSLPALRTYERPVLVALVGLALALRLGGVLHPHARASDLGLNANNLADLTRGNLYITEGLPSRVGGGGQAPYPPGQYLALAPLQLFVAPDHDGRRLAIMIGNSIVDALVVALIWYLLRRGAGAPGAALVAASLYVVATPLLQSFSIGEYANVFGQALALPALALLGVAGWRLADRRVALPALALLAAALLGHLGVAISLAFVLVALVLAWATARPRMPVLRLVLLLLGAALFAGLCYYSAFAFLIEDRLARHGGTASAAEGALVRLIGQLSRLGRPDNTITPLLIGLGAAGLALFWRVRHAPGLSGARRSLQLLLTAWWAGVLLSFGLFLIASQGVRWEHFLFPALCLGAGMVIVALWRRGRAGRAVAVLTLGFLLWRGVLLWVVQIIDYLHS